MTSWASCTSGTGESGAVWRLFIALPVPEPLRLALQHWQQSAQRHLPEGLRWTPAAQLHLTLRFLGDVACDQVPPLTEAFQRACTRTAPFSLTFHGLGCFPSPDRPRVLWAGLSGQTTSLHALQQRIQQETAAWGQSEDRPFVAHLTLARIRDFSPAARQGLTRHLTHLPTLPQQPWTVDHVILYRSQLQPQGAIHTALHRCVLQV